MYREIAFLPVTGAPVVTHSDGMNITCDALIVQCDACGAAVVNCLTAVDAHYAFHRELVDIENDARTAALRTRRIG